MKKGMIIRHLAVDGCPIGRFMKVVGTSKLHLRCNYLQNGIVVDRTSEYIVGKKKAHIYKVVTITTTEELIEYVSSPSFDGYIKYPMTKMWEKLSDENPEETVVKFISSHKRNLYVYVKFERSEKIINRSKKQFLIALFGVHTI